MFFTGKIDIDNRKELIDRILHAEMSIIMLTERVDRLEEELRRTDDEDKNN